MLADSLIDARNHHRGIASVLSRGVDSVTIPGAVGESGKQERGFSSAQDLIQPGRIAWRISLMFGDLYSRLLKMPRGSRCCSESRRLVPEFRLGPLVGGVNIRCDFLAVFVVIVGQHIRV